MTFIYPGAVFELGAILKQKIISKIFLVTGKESFELSGAKKILTPIFNSYEVIQFNKFNTNPNLIDLLSGIELFNDNRCNIIVSVGGGSVIDMAKLVNYYKNFNNLLNISEQNLTNQNFIPTEHICITTTAGSGSEETSFAVLYIENIKFSIANYYIKPKYVIIDPKLHQSQTPYQKAISGADAFSQAIESIWSINSNENSIRYSEIALKLLWENLPKSIYELDEFAQLNVAKGANFAGKAINITKTTAPHALSYGITSCFKIPHGHAVSIFLPYFIKYHKNLNDALCAHPNGAGYVVDVITKIASILSVEYSTLEYSIIHFFNEIGITINFNKLNIGFDQYLESMKNINQERLQNNPGIVSNINIIEIFTFNNNA